MISPGITRGPGITPLHVRSGYSLLCGTGTLERLVALAAAQGHARIALTDVNGLYGAPAFWKLATDAGLRPILGAELREGGHSIVALVADETGYENLCQIITKIADCRLQIADFPAAIAELSAGLHFIVEDASLAACLLAEGMGPERLWLGLDPATRTHSQIRQLTECAQQTRLPLVATGKALLAEAEDYDVARLLAAIRVGATYDSVPAEELPHPRAFLRSGRQIAESLAEFPEAASSNRRLAEECSAFQFLPRRPVFPDFPCPGGLPARDLLRRLCREGLRRRYGEIPSEPAEYRLRKELGLIERMGFSEYFLVVWDIVQYARRCGAPVAGRGSGASSIVAYVLGITNVCPLAYDIPFERFLHERREDFPDLDVDFCWRIRDDVIDYAFRRWGKDRVAMVCTHNTFQPASAVRETAKAFGLSNEQISEEDCRFEIADFRLNSNSPEPQHEAGESKISAPKSAIRNPQSEIRNLKSAICNLQSEIPQLARRITGLPHNLSVHPGGIVIGRKPIDHYVPIQPAAKGVTITQYDKNGVEDINLVKLDLLGNRCLSTIRYACDLIQRHRGENIDVETLPPGDADTIRMLQRADTIGCNQLESPAMRHLLKMMQPKDTRDVMKVLALIRPGAASVGMKEVFVRRHRGLEAVPTGQEQADALLGGTCGVMLYEDDVMLVASAMLGCGLPEADRFRKAVQKCRGDEERLRISREFLSRCAANGVDLDYAKGMWVQMAKFNAYSFCRAHAASYALLAYAGAYLKAHYALEFWTAALNNNQGMWHPRVYVEQAKREGIPFLLPDVNRSQEEFSIEDCIPGAAGNESNRAKDGTIRVGLNRVAGLGPVGVKTILEQRSRRPFEGLSDFLSRTRLGEDQTRALVLCGAFDSFGRTRPTLMMELNLGLKTRTYRGSELVGSSLLPVWPTIPNMPGDYDDERKYLDERRILGVSVRRHIMARYRGALQSRGDADADSRDLSTCIGRRVRIAGVQEAQRSTRTGNGQHMMFLTLEDEFGPFEVTLFPDACKRSGGVFTHYGPYVVRGKVEEQYGSITVSADSIRLLGEPRSSSEGPQRLRQSRPSPRRSGA